MDMILEVFIKLISSFVGTLGFAIFMHAPKRAWLPASIIGGVSYALYWALLQFGTYEYEHRDGNACQRLAAFMGLEK